MKTAKLYGKLRSGQSLDDVSDEINTLVAGRPQSLENPTNGERIMSDEVA